MSKNFVNEKLFDDSFQAEFRDAFINQKDFDLNGCIINSNPFPVCMLKDVLDERFALDLKKELLDLEFKEKSNDLYDFYQSENLCTVNSENLVRFRDCLSSFEFMNMMHKLTGIELDYDHKIDLAGQRYKYKGNLLCHDDELEGRRIAFILYLVDPSWSAADGGALQLYASDSNNLPIREENKVHPCFNSFAFFEVTPTSYHSISEILAKDKERVSLTGWFYGPPKEFKDYALPVYLPIYKSEFSVDTWINLEYLKPEAVKSILERFVEDSSIQLQSFLQVERYNAIKEAILTLKQDSSGMYMTKTRGSYQSFGLYCSNPIVRQFMMFLTSIEFTSYLKQITNLAMKACVCSELRKFGHSDYTLIHDKFSEPCGLDLLFTMPFGDWKEEWGGVTNYLIETEPVLSVTPVENTLNLVFRDEGVYRFVKYVNADALSFFADFNFIYQLE